ncbi:MAG: FecR family protein [Parcubacteria group bacterium]
MSANDTRRADAALWRTRLEEEPQLALTPEYLDWSAEPANRALSDRADEAWDLVGELSATPEMIALRHAALADARKTAARRWSPRLPRMAAAIAAGVVLAASAGGAWLLSPTIYRTDIGERRVVTLQDGSRISLDAASEVKVRYTHGARKLELVHGQARFDVARDLARPFVVDAGDRTVSATKGAFNIDRAARKVCVTLLDGAAIIRPDAGLFHRAAPEKPRLLNAGQQLTVASRGEAVATADPREVTAWERGELVFTNEPLADAVARVNRYSVRRIEVDPSAAPLRISGAFNAGDTASFLDAMASYFNLEAVPSSDGKVMLQARS